MASVSAPNDRQNLTEDSALRGRGFAKRVDAVPLTRERITNHGCKRLDRGTSSPATGGRELSFV